MLGSSSQMDEAESISTLLRSGCKADTSSPIGNCGAPIRLHAGTPLFSTKPLSSVSICKRPRLPGLTTIESVLERMDTGGT